MRPGAWLACVVAWLWLFGCHNRHKEALATFKEAQAHFTRAQTALGDGRLNLAHQEYDQAQQLVFKLRLGTARPMSDEPGEGPVVSGLTAQAWEAKWESTFKETIDARFELFQRMGSEGSLDFAEADAFLMTYRPDLEPRWSDTIGSAAQGQLKRLGETYLFECSSPDDEACQVVFDAVAERLARPLTRERLTSGSARAQTFGMVSASIQTSEARRYEYSSEPRTDGAYELPGVMSVGVSVETHRGHSSWDGVKHFEARLEPPTAVLVNEKGTAQTKHYRALFDSIERQVKAVEKQSVSP